MPFLAILVVLCFSISIRKSPQNTTNKITQIHFLVPGGVGGGWDATARSVGEVLRKTKLVEEVSYENMSGGGGGKAIAHLIETAKHQQQTLMVNSTPIVIRSLQKVFPQSFRDLTPVASIIGDYSCLAVTAESKYKDWEQVVTAYKKKRFAITIAGGSVKGGMDHLVAAMICEACGINLKDLVYIPYDAGGKALAGLLSGETQFLSTGLGEAMELAKAGKLHIVVVTAPKRIEAIPKVPTFRELGYDVVFANWRGFFAPPGLVARHGELYDELFRKMHGETSWKDTCVKNGWTEIYHANNDFTTFLQDQEEKLAGLMLKLGFVK
ncbi:tripartite tricarboxylate transporter substrate binding protein [Candidatus Uabimicrobium sp. HlEnr_7]|uniref:tripartite tricarboxylate transporter substrate binding protein n=1 Tax=Candidatus Uabimicrobium helgolandensis TaxID=3095367 RepID=UPI00355737D8